MRIPKGDWIVFTNIEELHKCLLASGDKPDEAWKVIAWTLLHKHMIYDANVQLYYRRKKWHVLHYNTQITRNTEPMETGTGWV